MTTSLEPYADLLSEDHPDPERVKAALAELAELTIEGSGTVRYRTTPSWGLSKAVRSAEAAWATSTNDPDTFGNYIEACAVALVESWTLDGIDPYDPDKRDENFADLDGDLVWLIATHARVIWVVYREGLSPKGTTRR